VISSRLFDPWVSWSSLEVETSPPREPPAPFREAPAVFPVSSGNDVEDVESLKTAIEAFDSVEEDADAAVSTGVVLVPCGLLVWPAEGLLESKLRSGEEEDREREAMWELCWKSNAFWAAELSPSPADEYLHSAPMLSFQGCYCCCAVKMSRSLQRLKNWPRSCGWVCV
jgi:hypothetical protein